MQVTVVFHVRSRNMTPHVDEQGAVHVCISDWQRVMYRLRRLNAHNDEPELAQEQLRRIVANLRKPTNGTRQQTPHS